MALIALGNNLFSEIDDEDFNLVSKYSWHIQKGKNTNYVSTSTYTNGKHSSILLHRLLFPNWKIIDHIDGNGLNNKRNNLRECNYSQNNYNSIKRKGNTTSRYKGVYFDRQTGKFKVKIILNKKALHLGYFNSEKDAGLAYNKAAEKYLGEYYRLNLIMDGE